jgi:hypothetical protein
LKITGDCGTKNEENEDNGDGYKDKYEKLMKKFKN